MFKEFADMPELQMKLTEMKNQYKNHLIFVAVSGIGDLCYALSSIEILKAQTNKKVVVFTREYTRETVEAFPYVDEVVVLNKEDADFFRSFSLPQNMQPVFNEYSLKYGVFFCTPLTEETYDTIKKSRTNYIDIIMESLGCSDDIKNISYPNVPQYDIGKFAFSDIKKTVIINPYSNSLVEKTDLFEKIAEILSGRGYTVYTNITGNQKPVPGTKSLRCNLKDLYNITAQCAAFVSIRSGIVDFSISNGGNFLVLYNGEWDGKFREAYSLEGWKTESTVYEYNMDQEKVILDFIDKWNI